MQDTLKKMKDRSAMTLKPFEKPIYITRPLLPDLKEMSTKLEEIWASGWLTNNGPQHVALERVLQSKLKVPCVSLFNNGTIGLIVACQCLRLSGEAITTPFTFPATPHVLAWNNIKPIFCDIDPVTLNIDARKIESLITPQTTAILGVHVFGTPCDTTAIRNIADRYGLRVIYDAAHAFGVEVDDAGIGNFGDISMMSFHATKAFNTAEGGALLFNDANFKKRIDFLKNFGIKNEEEVVMPGINGKMNEIQAVLGLLNIRQIDNEISNRKRLVETYRSLLANIAGISYLQDVPRVRNNYSYFVIRIDKKLFGLSRDEVYQRFREFNVFTRKYFYPLCSEYSCYRHIPSASPSNLPTAHKVAQEVLCLPLYGGLAISDIEQICNILQSFRR